MCAGGGCAYVRMYVCAYVRMCVCAYVRMCVCAYVRMCVRRYAMPDMRTLLSNLLPVTVVARPTYVGAC